MSGPWLAATDVNVFTPLRNGKPAKYTYLETRFTLPKSWPAKRVFLDSPKPLGWLILNDHVIQTADWMKSLDISGLVLKNGENVLRWAPSDLGFKREYTQPAPELQLSWMELSS